MKIIKRTLLVLTILFLCLVGLFIGQIIYISKPTHGDKIESYDSPQQALMVIDIQEDFTGTTAKAPFPYKDAQKLIATVNTIIETANKKNIQIIYIKQELDDFPGVLISKLFVGGVAIKGKPGTEIDKRLSIVSPNIFPKPRSDSFSNASLETFLTQHHVNELYLVGLDADGCVHATAQGALNRGYAVNIITDAIVLQAEGKWNQLLKEYQDEGITLLSSQEFIGMQL